jgi:hypothetical protein
MIRRWPLILAGAVLGAAACARHDSGDDRHASVLSTIERTTGDASGGGLTALNQLAVIATVKAEAATAVPEFFVLARRPKLQKAPCVGCHTLPLASMKWDGRDGKTRAHWPISLKHASGEVMTCLTCHSPADLDVLRTLTERTVSFDHSYRVCAQCHSKQAADWAGGAHGKRVGGWAPPRIVYGCAECHNPHQPALESRWPARAGRAIQ